ncbi:SDR family oxidoreductase [Sorangium sp. So ce1389]|uniref:SDR family oxidoreductase n=1 Tax=Sorangium sp. So ce1389 TaxID=3133336 RepID=UPI003F5E064E
MHDRKVALVTGANKGIGFEVARQLGQRGMTALVGARDPERGEAAALRLREEGVDARFVRLDVTDGATIDAAARRIEAELGRLDVLVNNAGIALDRNKPSECNLDEVRQIYEVNVLGVVAVTKAMLPMLRRAAPHARIVNVTSGLGSLTLHTDPSWEHGGINVIGYTSSKAALNMVTVQLAKELRGTGIKVNAADPGYTATDLNNNTGTQTVAEGAESTVTLATLGDDGPTGGYFDRRGRVPW